MIPAAPQRKATVPRARTGAATAVDIPDDLRAYLEGSTPATVWMLPLIDFGFLLAAFVAEEDS